MKLKKMLAMGLAVTMVLGTTGCGIKVSVTPANESKTKVTEVEEYQSEIRDLGELLAEAERGNVADDSMESADQNTVVITSEGSSENTLEGDWVSTLETALEDPTSSPVGSVIADNVYECAQVGLKFTTPEGYYVAADEMAMMNSFMSLAQEAEGGSGEFVGVPIPASVFEGKYIMRIEFLAMEEDGTSGCVMIQTLQTDDMSFFVDVINEKGEKVSKWGQEWFCLRDGGNMVGVEATGDTYCLELEGMLYMVNIIVDEGSNVSLDKLMNAFEQM